MHCSPSADGRVRTGRAHRAAIALLVGLLACNALAADPHESEPGFTVRSANTRLVNGVHRVRASIAFNFSEEAVDAMQNGVAVTVAVEMQVLQVGRLLDRKVASVAARYRIQVHALSHQFFAKNLSTGETATYRSIEEMSEQLGTIDDFPLLDDHVLHDDESYRVRIRATLDIDSLPTPLRLLAYFRSSWRLTSDWTSWPLQR